MDFTSTFRRTGYSIVIGTLIAFLSSANVCAADSNSAIREVLEANPDAMSAIMLLRGNGVPVCTIGKIIDGQMVADNARTAVLSAPEFREWHNRGELTQFAEVHPNVKGLHEAMQAARCMITIESARNIAYLSRELELDGMIFRMMPAPLQKAQIDDAYAISLGFKDNAELLLAASMMASKDDLQTYYALGVNSKSDYDNAVARMRSDGYSDNPAHLLDFLKDEAEGIRRNLSATEIREERKSAGASLPQGTAAN